MKPLVAKVFEELEETRKGTLAMIEGIPDEVLMNKPGSEWSIAQVLEHLYQVELSSVKVVRHLFKKAETPLPPYPDDESAIPIASFSQPENLEAPEVVKPPDSVSPEEVKEKLRNIRRTTRETLELLSGFDPRSMTFPHPFLGDLHTLEWFAFLPDHERIHQRQIRKIIETM